MRPEAHLHFAFEVGKTFGAEKKTFVGALHELLVLEMVLVREPFVAMNGRRASRSPVKRLPTVAIQ
jgi:hypothetical protein